MTLLEQITTDLVAAMKAKDEARLSTLRMVKTALDKQQKDSQKPLEPITEQKVLATLVKQRRDSVDMFTKGNRLELAAKEQAEILVIEAYMPKEATAEDLDRAIEAVYSGFAVQLNFNPKKDFGKIMNGVQTYLVGKRFDGRILSEKIKIKLSTMP